MQIDQQKYTTNLYSDGNLAHYSTATAVLTVRRGAWWRARRHDQKQSWLALAPDLTENYSALHISGRGENGDRKEGLDDPYAAY